MQRRLRLASLVLVAVTAFLFCLPVNRLSTRVALLSAGAAAIALWVLGQRARGRWAIATAAFLAAGAVVLSLPGPEIPKDALRRRYVRALESYRDAPYLWGGEAAFGIDCSGLARRGLRDALVETAIADFNPAALRLALASWWNDQTARDLLAGADGTTTRHARVASVREPSFAARLRPGDLLVTVDGRHVMAFIGEGHFISADPAMNRVVVVRIGDGYGYLDAPVVLVRWSMLE